MEGKKGSSDIGEQFEELIESTQRMIYNLGLRLFNNEEDALDFSQDVYLKAYAARESFRGESKFSTWLYSLALNYGLNRIKKEKKLKFISGESFDLVDSGGLHWDAISERRGYDENPVEKMAEEEKKNRVEKELNLLPDVYRIPLLLFYYERMSYARIADFLDIKEGTLKSYIHRGKIILKNKLLHKI